MNVIVAMRIKTRLHSSALQHLWFDDLHVFSLRVCMANLDVLRQSFTSSVLKRRGFHIVMVKLRVSWEKKKGPHADITRYLCLGRGNLFLLQWVGRMYPNRRLSGTLLTVPLTLA